MCKKGCALSPPLCRGCNKVYRTLVLFVAVLQQHTKTEGIPFGLWANHFTFSSELLFVSSSEKALSSRARGISSKYHPSHSPIPHFIRIFAMCTICNSKNKRYEDQHLHSTLSDTGSNDTACGIMRQLDDKSAICRHLCRPLFMRHGPGWNGY